MATQQSKVDWLLQNPDLVEAIEALTHLLADAGAEANGCKDPAFHDALVPEASAAVNEMVCKFVKHMAEADPEL